MDDVQRVRAELVAKEARLTRTERSVSAHLRNADRELPADAEDRAEMVEGDEVYEALDEHARRELAAIRAAIARIDAGVAPTCGRCGRPIEPARLVALPTADTCVRCAG